MHFQLIKSISVDAVNVLLVDRYEAAWYSGVVPGLVAGRLWDGAPGAIPVSVLQYWKYNVPTCIISFEGPINASNPELQVVDAQLKEKAQENSQQTLNVCIVGGGVAGVEMALCLFQRWNRCSGLAGRVRMDPPAAVHLESRASSIAATDVVLEDGGRVPADAVVWACGGQPQTIPGRRGFGPLRLSDAGFVLVDSYLSSVSHPWVFAAGDCMAMENTHIPKAGVFAVRAAAPLTTTLTALLRECSSSPSASAGPRPLCDHPRKEAVRRCITTHGEEFKPQMEFLRLLNMGDRTALGTKFGIWFRGAWVWRLKDYIDQSFLDSFRSEEDQGGDTGGDGGRGEDKGGEFTASHTAGSGVSAATPARQYDDMLGTASQTMVARMTPLAGAWVLQMPDADWLAKCGAVSSDVPQAALGMDQHILAFSVLKRMAHDADWCNAVVQEVRRIQPPV